MLDGSATNLAAAGTASLFRTKTLCDTRARHLSDRLVLATCVIDHLVRLPEVLLSTCGTDEPWREEAAVHLPCPRFLELLVHWDNLATRSLLDEPDGGVDEDVRHDTSDKTISDGVGERHDGDGEESGNSITHVSPVDVGSCLGHQRTNDDKSTSSSPWGNGGKDGGEEDGNEEADTGDHGGNTSLTALRNTSTRLNECSNRRGTEQRADRDTDSIDQVGSSTTLEVLSLLIHDTSEASHSVESTSAVQNIDVEESDQSKTELTTVGANIPFLSSKNVLDRAESNDVLEEVEVAVAELSVREVSDVGATRPGDDGDEQDTSNDCTLDAEHHEEDSQETTAEDTNPHGGRSHLVAGVAHQAIVLCQVLLRASSNFERCAGGTSDKTNTSAVTETNDCEVETNTDTCSKLDGCGNGASKPLTNTEDCKSDEQKTFYEDGGKGDSVRDKTGTVETNDSVGEVCVDTHTRCQT